MTLYWDRGQVIDDQQEGVRVPAGATRVTMFRNPAQYGSQEFGWDPAQRYFSGGIESNAPGYLPELFARLDRQRTGQLQPWEAEELGKWEATARAMPTRDTQSLTAGWQGEPGAEGWWSRLDPGSPDAGPLMLALRDKLEAGTATAQERALYGQVRSMAEDWRYRAQTPQESDASPFGLGDNLFGALFTLGLGASGGLAAAPLAAGGASLGTTLGSLGSLSGTAGQIGGLIGGATGQDWLAQAGKYVGALGGIASGVGGLTNLAGTGVQNLSDAARLAQSAGRITGGIGTASGVEPFQQAGRYLGYAGQAGSLGAGAADWLGWGGTNSPLASNVAPQGVSNLLSAAEVATQRGGGPMEYYDADLGGWDAWTGGGGDLGADYSSGGGSYYDADLGGVDPWMGSAYQGGQGDFPGGGLSLEQQVAQAIAQRPDLYGTSVSTGAGGGGGLLSTLGGLASGAGKLLFGGGGSGGGAGIGGPLLSALGSVGGGAIGSNAANEAARLQSQALNRGIDLQTAQWLQQQQNLAPYLQAGQGGLAQLQQLAGREQPSMPGATPAYSSANFTFPGAAPGWTPQAYEGPQAPNAGDYRWTPGQGPQAQDYRYTPGNIPSAAANRWTPGQGPSAADYRYAPGQTPDAANYRYTPGAVPTLSGQELLANDPGVQFRMDEGRKALEASAAARGGLLSGGTLAALQRQGQELSSQEYGQAFARAAQQAQMREGWQQTATAQNFGQAMSAAQLREQLQQYATQQGWSQAQTEAVFREQMAQQSSQQGYGQQLSEATLREQVNQIASQQGWTQAQAEAVFREQMGQQASQQGWNQALAGQQNQFTQGLQAQQWNQKQAQSYETDLYNRMLEQQKMRYGMDVTENTTNYDRAQQSYRQQLGQHLLPWEQQSTLANLGGQATSIYGSQGNTATSSIGNLLSQLGTAQGTAPAASGLSWQRALTGATNQVPSLLASLNA